MGCVTRKPAPMAINMNAEQIFRMLENSGFHVLGLGGGFVRLEDPSCILRGFETFLEYAWIIILFITGVLLFGWAVAIIRGAKNGPDNLLINLRNLVIIFGTLSAVKPIVNFIYGGNIFARGCDVIRVSLAEIGSALDLQNAKLSLCEDVVGLGSCAPVNDFYGAGEPVDIAAVTEPGRGISSARESGKDVIIVRDGREYIRSGGSRAWRNNNPGNIICSDFAQRQGSVGCAGRFAVFPDEATGMAAITANLRTSAYQTGRARGCPSLPAGSLGAAICRWAPPTENDTKAYQRMIEKRTGIPVNTQMSSLDDAQLGRVANTIRAMEGWKQGTEKAV